MAVQQYCLRWNNHQPNFIQVFSTLLHSESLVDVTLAAEGRQLQAHKVVLSACSSYFQSLFTTNPCKHPIVILKDVQYNDLKTMVDFMYYGEVNVSTEQLPQILKTAEMLKIKGLAEMPDNGTVTKSESKSVEHADPNQMASESIWSNAESQQAQYQQQQPQLVQIHQQRCSASPPKSMSPALRRKRVRKSESGSGSIERQEQQLQQLQNEHMHQQQQQQQQEHGTSAQQVDSNDQSKILYFPHLNSSTRVLTSSSTLISAQQANALNQVNVNRNSVKDTDTEQPQHDSSQESIDESHQPNIMKTEMDLQGVSQTVPLDISGSSSISMTQAHQQHPGQQWAIGAIVDTSSYPPRFATASLQQQQQQLQAAQQQQHQHHGNTENHSLNTSTSSTSSNGNNTASVQMYQTNSGNYQSQIISVNPNTMVSSYPQSLSTSTSPQAASGTQIVQSVYSQSIKQSPSPTEESPVATNVSTNPTPTTPSTGGPTKRKRSVNPQGDENFLRALDAVRFGGIGFCKAARLYGVNNRTLWLEYKKRGYPISRPSIKNRIKLEPNMSPAPSSTPNNDENSMENYDSLPATSISMTTTGGGGGGSGEGGNTSGNPLMCPPHVMGFLDTRHVDFSSAAALHPVPRQRYDDGTLINPAAVNLQGLNFNSM